MCLYLPPRIAQNNHTAGSGTYGVPGQGGPGVRIGSFVETQLLNALNLVNVNGEFSPIQKPIGVVSTECRV
jgi:hypothetical protein